MVIFLSLLSELKDNIQQKYYLLTVVWKMTNTVLGEFSWNSYNQTEVLQWMAYEKVPY